MVLPKRNHEGTPRGKRLVEEESDGRCHRGRVGNGTPSEADWEWEIVLQVTSTPSADLWNPVSYDNAASVEQSNIACQSKHLLLFYEIF
jgi:hypothetical protein